MAALVLAATFDWRAWRVEATYIGVKGGWTYLYRAVNKDGDTISFIVADAQRRFLGPQGWL